MASPGNSQGSSDVVIPARAGRLSGLVDRPPNVRAAFCLAHGAGAGMRHAFLTQLASALVGHDIATLRFQFPYMEQGRARTDVPEVAMAAIVDAVRHCEREFPGLPILA